MPTLVSYHARLIERYTAHLVRAGVEAGKAARAAYPIMMMLHGVVISFRDGQVR